MKDTKNATESDTNKYNSDITKEDLQALGKDFQNNIRQDGGDDTMLADREKKVDFAGRDLDVPGRSEASKTTTNRTVDEENMLHSQGSGSNENLEEQSARYTK